MKLFATVIATITLLVGCQSHRLPADDDSTPNAVEAQRRPSDAPVLETVYRDVLAYDGEGSPRGMHVIRDDGNVLVAQSPCAFKITIDRALFASFDEKATELSADQKSAAHEAAGDLVRRFDAGDPFDGFPSADVGIAIESDAAATQPHRLEMRNRAICTWAPGYSRDKTLAVVRLSIPWSIHSGDATYVLAKRGTVWTIVYRDFRWYV